MTEREYYRETNGAATNRPEVYEETSVEQTGVDPVDGVQRNVYQERVAGPNGDRVVRREHVSVPSEATQRAVTVTRIKQVIYFISGAINVLLAIRFVLLILGASDASSFVRLIYGLSRPFVAPFQGIFGEPAFNTSVVEWASLVGIIVYMLVAYGIARLVEISYAPSRPTIAE